MAPLKVRTKCKNVKNENNMEEETHESNVLKIQEPLCKLRGDFANSMKSSELGATLAALSKLTQEKVECQTLTTANALTEQIETGTVLQTN